MPTDGVGVTDGDSLGNGIGGDGIGANVGSSGTINTRRY